jgi:hypothetical protein
MINRLARPSQGKLVALNYSAVWRSPPIRSGAPRLRAEATFSLVNRGRAAVHVTSLESGCGCTTPRITPTTVQPDGTALVTAIGTPLSSGERTVAITVHTDSPLSPEIVLHFKMVTDRLPPFITEVAGDFAYDASYSTDEARDFIVNTVESDG